MVNKERLPIILKRLQGKIFKIIPLLEDKNKGIESYMESLIFKLKKLDSVIDLKDSYEYVHVMMTLVAIRDNLKDEHYNFDFIRKEILESLNVLNKLIEAVSKDE